MIATMYRILFLCLLLFSPSSFAGDPLIIDVRSSSEFSDKHVEDALNIEHSDIANGAQQRNIEKDSAIYLYCGTGKRAEMARQSLLKAGYSNVTNLGGLQQALEFSSSQD
jgi:phage shock protein E